MFREDNGLFCNYYGDQKGNGVTFLEQVIGMPSDEAWRELARVAGVEAVDKCKFCEAAIEWQDKKPFNLDGTPHDCKKGKKGKKASTIVEQDGKTYIAVTSKNPSIGEESEKLLEICNFTMRIISKIWNDNCEVSWLVKITTATEEKEVELAGAELNIGYKFRDKISSKGPFLVSKTESHNQFIEFVLSQSKIEEKVKTQYIGRTTRKAFVFSNLVAYPGRTEPLNGLILTTSQKLFLKEPQEPDFWKETLREVYEIYKSEAWKVLGFNTATLFVDEVVNRFSGFPLEFINGESGSGKNVLFTFQLGFFGGHLSLRPFNFNSTNKAWYRDAEKFRGIPLVLNEYQPNQKNNSTVIGLYDREGYHRAKTSNDLDTHTTQVNATFILVSTRAITGYESQAVNSRLITIDMDKVRAEWGGKERWKMESWPKVMELRKKLPYLSSFIPLALQLNINKVLEDIEKEIDNNSVFCSADPRLIQNYSIVKCFNNAVVELLGLDKKYIVGDITSEIERSQGLVNESNAGILFLQTLTAMVERIDPMTGHGGDVSLNIAKIKGSSDDRELIFKLGEVYPYVRRFINQTYGQDILPDQKTLANLLKNLGAKAKSTRDFGAMEWGWSYKFPNNKTDITDITQTSQ